MLHWACWHQSACLWSPSPCGTSCTDLTLSSSPGTGDKEWQWGWALQLQWVHGHWRGAAPGIARWRRCVGREGKASTLKAMSKKKANERKQVKRKQITENKSKTPFFSSLPPFSPAPAALVSRLHSLHRARLHLWLFALFCFLLNHLFINSL